MGFVTRKVRKRGGWRTVEDPDYRVKTAQRQLLKLLMSHDPVRSKGVHEALNELRANITQGFHWIASIDIKDCFPSINPKKPLGMIDTRITEGVPGLYGRRSLPPGHPISPYLAERYLSQFDRMVESWQTPTYLSDGSRVECRTIRYVDNIWLMCRKKKELESHVSLSLDYVSGLGLTPRIKPVRHVNQGIDVLGWTVTRWSIRPSSRNIQRFKERWRKYAKDRKQLEGELSKADKAESIEEIKAAIRCLDRKFYESQIGWQNYFGPGLRSWLDRFLLGLNIDLPYRNTPNRDSTHLYLVKSTAMKNQTRAEKIDHEQFLLAHQEKPAESRLPVIADQGTVSRLG